MTTAGTSPHTALPGADLVATGLADLRAGRTSEEACLVVSAAPRLRALGYAVPDAGPDDPDLALYELVLARVGPRRAHGAYNALRRRMVSFLRASPRATTR